MLSFVIPLYNERESLSHLWLELVPAADALSSTWEAIFVDDGSTDGSADVLRELAASDDRITVIPFRRNRGKAAALQAGFERAKGSIVATMDADLQDDPAELHKLIDRLNQGFDLVTGYKKDRHDPIHKTVPSRFFNGLIRKLSGTKLHDVNCGMKAYRKEVLDTLFIYGELYRFIPILAASEGFKVDEVAIRHRPRTYGTSKYGVSRFVRGILDLITVIFLTKFLKRPLHFFGTLGAAFLAIGALACVYLSFLRLFLGHSIGERPLLLFGVLLIIAGIQLISTGLIAELITHYAQRADRQ